MGQVICSLNEVTSFGGGNRICRNYTNFRIYDNDNIFISTEANMTASQITNA
jgi:hypothetical protein